MEKIHSSGNNHNMNHIVRRIETRVLAPPGGFSSFSLCSSPSPAGAHSRERRARYTREPPLHNAHRSQQNKENVSSGNGVNNGVNHKRRDSLDELLSSEKNKVIPGLEGMYTAKANDMRSLNDGGGYILSCYSDNRRDVMNKVDYAEVLRQQIDTKKRLDKEAKGKSNFGSSRPPYPQYNPVHEINCKPTQCNSSLSHRRRYGSGGGASSISLSWE